VEEAQEAGEHVQMKSFAGAAVQRPFSGGIQKIEQGKSGSEHSVSERGFGRYNFVGNSVHLSRLDFHFVFPFQLFTLNFSSSVQRHRPRSPRFIVGGGGGGGGGGGKYCL
jgi:hypothetical protein